MYYKTHKAFTMIELIFVIIIIGVLSAIAVPKFNASRTDAVITKAKVTVASLRNAISTERQLRTLKGDFTAISELGTAPIASPYDKDIFDYFEGNASHNRIFEYKMKTCKTNTSKGCWTRTGAAQYTYTMPTSGSVPFSSAGSRFDCNTSTSLTSGANCILLTQ